jgi:anti-sigma regulatory factor (Ser/Thr protein kinase)
MPPQQLMHALDAVARDLPDQLITCCYLMIDPDAGELTACSAGHLPILSVEPDASVRRLPIPVSVPLGVGDVPHVQATLPVAECATLVLYTDGLVETHRCDLDDQIGALEAELRAVFGAGFGSPIGLEHAADRVLTALLPRVDEPPDDVTLLLVRIPEAPFANASTALSPAPKSVAVGRHFVERTLVEWGRLELVDTACLLVSEILTNAVRHACSPIGLRLHQNEREVTLEITDDSTHLPQRRLADPDDENGRGLMLVDALADNWGTRATSTGKTVWITLSVEPDEGGPPEIGTGEAASPIPFPHQAVGPRSAV